MFLFFLVVVIMFDVSLEIDLSNLNGLGYVIWYIVVVGIIFMIVCICGCMVWVGVGVVFFIIYIVIWVGLFGIVIFGVIGSVSWVMIVYVICCVFMSVVCDVCCFSMVECEIIDW